MAEIFNFNVQDNRSIQFPRANLLEPIMQEDYKVATWRFRIPKTLNGIDMSAWAWWFVYTNAKNEKFSELLTLVDDIDEPDSYCTADYDIDYGISYNPGSFSFSLEAINAESGGAITGEWHTKTYAHKVDKTLQGNQAQWAETESDIISALIIEVQNKVTQLVGGATPEPKSLIADMTDTKKVYLYVGEETGESTNYWYYHNGSAWVAGGLYASGITIDAVPTQGSSNAVSSGGVYAENSEIRNSINDANIRQNSAEGKIKTVPFGRSGTAGALTVEYAEGKIKIDGTLSSNSVVLEADADAVPVGSSLSIPYRQSANSGLFDDNANARKVHVDAGRYRLVYNMLSGTVTKGGVTYTSNADFGTANVVTAFVLKPDASASGYTLFKSSITTEVDLEDGQLGMLVLYCYNGCSFDDAVFELYLEKVEVTESPEINTLQSEIELLCGQSTVENLFRQGGYNRGGNALSGQRAYYIVTTNYVSDDLIMLKTSGDYYLTILAWDSEGTFAGFRNSENSLTTTATQNVYWTQELWVSKYKELYPDLKFKIEITTKDTIDGTLTNIVPSEAVNAVAYYVGKDTGINPQYKAEMDATIASVHDAITEPALVFPLVTDIHYQSVNNFFDDCIDNMKAFAESVKCDFILNLGDDTDGNQTQEITLARAYYMRKRFNEIDVPYYHAIGNHDTNYYQSHPKLSSDQIYSAYLSNTRGVHFDMTAGEKNFYRDFDELGIRLVVLDGNHNTAYAFSANTATWLANTALDTDYIVVIGVHFSPIANQNWASKAMTNAPAVASAIQAFVDNGGTVIQFCGHSHVDYAFSTPWLSIHCDCQKFEQVDTSMGGYDHLIENADDFDSPARVEGTATEDCWNVIVIKPISRTVDLIRFGAGNDRTYSF